MARTSRSRARRAIESTVKDRNKARFTRESLTTKAERDSSSVVTAFAELIADNLVKKHPVPDWQGVIVDAIRRFFDIFGTELDTSPQALYGRIHDKAAQEASATMSLTALGPGQPIPHS